MKEKYKYPFEREGYQENLTFLMEKFPDATTLTVEEAASVLKISKDSVYALFKRVDRPMPFTKIGGNIRVSLPTLALWLCG